MQQVFPCFFILAGSFLFEPLFFSLHHSFLLLLIFCLFFFNQSFLLLLIFYFHPYTFLFTRRNNNFDFLIRKSKKRTKHKLIITYLGVGGCFNFFLINISLTSSISSSCLLFCFLVSNNIVLLDECLQFIVILVIFFPSTRSSVFKTII